MILCTCITSPLLVQRFGSRLHPVEGVAQQEGLFDRILVPVANPDTEEHLITLAGILSRSTSGVLMPLHVAQDIGPSIVGLAHQRRLLDSAVLRDSEADMQPLRRIDTSIAKGILHAAMENDATLIVMGWRGRPSLPSSVLGTVLDEVVWNAMVPVVVGRVTTPINAVERIVLVVPPRSLPAGLGRKTTEIAVALARAINVPLHVLAAERYEARLRSELARLAPDQSYKLLALDHNVTQAVASQANAQQLVLVTTMGSRIRFRSSLGQIPEQIAAATPSSVVVIHYPRQARMPA
jgi:nucleotide-binding universal stress UspA family protein